MLKHILLAVLVVSALADKKKDKRGILGGGAFDEAALLSASSYGSNSLLLGSAASVPLAGSAIPLSSAGLSSGFGLASALPAAQGTPVQISENRHTHITRKYAVPIPQPVPVTVQKDVHVPVPHPVAVPVPRPVPVQVPHPVAVPVDKPVPVRVDQPYAVPFPVKIPVPVEQHVSVPVPQPIAVPVAKPVPVPVSQPVPVPHSVPVVVRTPGPVIHAPGPVIHAPAQPALFSQPIGLTAGAFAPQTYLAQPATLGSGLLTTAGVSHFGASSYNSPALFNSPYASGATLGIGGLQSW